MGRMKRTQILLSLQSLDFELLFDTMGNNDMFLPKATKAFILLDGANVEDSDRKFALSIASDIKFDTMKATLKRIFSQALHHNLRANHLILLM